MRNNFKVITVLGLILAGFHHLECDATVLNPTDSAILSMHKYIDDNIDKFEYKKISSTPEHLPLITTYTYNGVSISQHILPGQLVNSLAYKLNDVEIDVEVGRQLFDRIEEGLKKAAKKRSKSSSLNHHDTCVLIEDILVKQNRKIK